MFSALVASLLILIVLSALAAREANRWRRKFFRLDSAYAFLADELKLWKKKEQDSRDALAAAKAALKRREDDVDSALQASEANAQRVASLEQQLVEQVDGRRRAEISCMEAEKKLKEMMALDLRNRSSIETFQKHGDVQRARAEKFRAALEKIKTEIDQLGLW